MRKLLFIFFLLPSLIKSQNLVPNWSFETYTACPGGGGEINKAIPWVGQTASGTTDYYNSCASGVFNVPYSSSGFQYAKDGVGRVGFWLYSSPLAPNVREYAQVMLIDTFTNGNCYYVEFYANLANQSRWACNNIAANLSKTQYSTTGTGYVLNLPQHITNNSNAVITDTLNWTKVSGIYIAVGGEKYLTVGNFKDDANTDTLKVFPTGVSYGSYYYLDAVSVYSINPASVLPWQYRDTTVALGDSVYIGNTMGGTFTSNWYTYGGTFINSGSGIYVKPVTTSTYVVQFTVCGVPRSDTLKVTVIGVGIHENTLFSNSIGIYPQPAKEIVNIGLNYFYEKSIDVRVTDVNGKIVRSSELVVRSGAAQMQVNDISDGVYVLELKNSSGQVARKRLIVAR